MNIKKLMVAMIVACSLQAGAAFAQDNNIELTDDSVTVGGMATSTANWTDNGAVNTTVGFEVQFDDTALTFLSCTILAPYNAAPYSSQCVIPAGETDIVRFGSLQIPSGQIVSGALFELSFTANGPAGTYNLTVINPSSSTMPVTTDPGVIEVLDVPAPNYNSTPTPGGTLDFGTPVAGMGNVDVMLNIENDGIPTGGTMDVDCSITNNPGGVYSLISPMDGMFTLDIGENADLTVQCDTTTPVDATGGTLSCAHTAPNAPNPATYTLDCFVTGEPTYASVPTPNTLIDLGDVPQNGAPPMQSLLINNDAGEVGSLLTGECSLQFNNTPISLVGGPTVMYSVVQGAAAASIDLTCDTSQGIQPYADNLICTSNDPNAMGDFNYPVNCEILQPVQAQYASTPARDPGNDPGTIEIDLTPVEPVLVGDADPTAPLSISNAAAAGSDFLELTGCSISSGTGEITVAPTPLTTNINPGESTGLTFSCATDTAGEFFARYTCPYDESPTDPPPIGADGTGGTTGTAIYDVRCEVRDPNSLVEVSPPDGTPQTAELMPGESTTFNFTFTETIGEGAAASLDDCTLSTGTDFAITAGGPFPTPIPSGGTVQVDVTFTDPGAGDTFNDTLSCAFSDSPPPPPVPGPDGADGADTFVSWPLEVTVIGRNATFNVTKDFDDDNPLGVEVTLDCNTGLPLMQMGTVHDPDAGGLTAGDFTELKFVVVDFEPGELDCEIFEDVPQGYEPDYFADYGDDGVADDVFDTAEGCFYEGIESADFICEIDNELQISEVVVNKEWIDENPEFALPTWVEITLWCNEPIFYIGLPAGPEASPDGANGGYYTATTFIQPGLPGQFGVFPHWDGTTECFVTETPEAGVLPDTSDCESIPLAPGVDGECTIVNTRLYAGIPTLSQYGLLLMALLMLGVGMVAFRRYS